MARFENWDRLVVIDKEEKNRGKRSGSVPCQGQYNTGAADSRSDLFCGAMREMLDAAEKLWLNAFTSLVSELARLPWQKFLSEGDRRRKVSGTSESALRLSVVARAVAGGAEAEARMGDARGIDKLN